MKLRSWLVASVLVSVSTPCFAQGHTADGAALGGVAGAIAGGIIGHQNDETPEGVLIGGAVGALAGGLLGNAKDDRIRQENLYRQQVYQQQQLLQQRAARAVSMSDVVSMTRSGLSEGLIINQIRTNGVQQELQTHDIIALHQQGVCENVIVAMQQAAQSGPAVVAPVPAPAPREVIVRREYHVVPRYAPPVRRVYVHPRPYPSRHRTHFHAHWHGR